MPAVRRNALSVGQGLEGFLLRSTHLLQPSLGNIGVRGKHAGQVVGRQQVQRRVALQRPHMIGVTLFVRESTELVVAVLPSFGFSWLLPRLPRFQQLQPNISVRLQPSLALSNLARESVDVGIRMGKGDWEGVEQYLLFHDETLVVAAPHFNGGVHPQTPEEIIGSNIIFNMESWQPWCQAAGLDREVPRIGLCSNDSNLVLQAVRLGQGIALERRSLVHDAIQRGELVQLSPVIAPYPYPYWLVLPNRERSETKQQVFSSWLKHEVAEYLNEQDHGSKQRRPAHLTRPAERDASL